MLAATSAGLFRTEDGGFTWKRIWDDNTFDVEFQHNNGKIVYATTNRVLKSVDAGKSFVAITDTCKCARYSVQIAASNPNVVYTLHSHNAEDADSDEVVEKSTNAGITWKTVVPPMVAMYGYYDNVLAVSPVNESVVIVAGVNLRRSNDGGNTWDTIVTAGHVDNHCIEFSPQSDLIMMCGNDGGVFGTENGGATWASLNRGLSITQFYQSASCKTNPNLMICGAQDNGNLQYETGLFSESPGIGDGMGGFFDWSNPRTIYAAFQDGDFMRSDDGGLHFRSIRTDTDGAWNAPWCQDPRAATTIYAGTDRIYQSTNQGATWTPISPVFGSGNRITLLKVAEKDPAIIYAGNGVALYRTVTGGRQWEDITAGLPVDRCFLTSISINDATPEVAIVTFSGYELGQKVYRTNDGGNTWRNISGTLPNIPVNCCVCQNAIHNPVYVGTDAGVYYIDDTLSDWIPFKFGMPNVIVDHLEIQYANKSIIAATYGRGMWHASLR